MGHVDRHGGTRSGDMSGDMLIVVVHRTTSHYGPGYDVILHPVTKAQFSTIEVLVAMPMTRWEFRIVPCLAGGNASATCLKMLFFRFADVQ